MISKKSFKKLKRAIVLSIALFNSCVDNKQVLNEINLFDSEPIGTAYNVRMGIHRFNESFSYINCK